MMNSRRAVKGQTVIIVALCALALLAFVALAVDGGSTLLQRRTMQNGADAGALAAVQAMTAPGIAVSCSPTPCHETYLVTNQTVWAAVTQFVNANQGGTNGTAAPVPTLEYHIMAGAPSCANPPNTTGCYQAAPNDTARVPDWTDGVRVTASIQNPTTFARAVNINTVPVSAAAAAKVIGTCPVAAPPGPSLPFTRFRPDLESELRTAANDILHPYQFWSANSPSGDSSWKLLLSFRERSLYNPDPTSPPASPNPLQLLTGVDPRNGLPSPGGNGVGPNYGSSGCTNSPLNPANCADMRGANPPDQALDLSNWTYWNWNGTIALTSTWPTSAQVGTRDGDWLEAYNLQANLGNNVAAPIIDVINRDGVMTALSGPPYNLGKALDKTVYVWGPDLATFQAGAQGGERGRTTEYAQQWNAGRINPTYQTGTWTDIAVVQKSNGQYGTSPTNATIGRVRFKFTYNFRFYAALQTNNSEVDGLFISEAQPGPVPPGNCGLTPGGAIYTRLTDP
jgi:hypothetical protein